MPQLTQLSELCLYQGRPSKSVRKSIRVPGTPLALKERVVAILPLGLGTLPSKWQFADLSIRHGGGGRKPVSFLSPHLAPVNDCTISYPRGFVVSINGFHVSGILPYVTFCIWLFFPLSIVLLRFILLHFFSHLPCFHLSGIWLGGEGKQR